MDLLMKADEKNSSVLVRINHLIIQCTQLDINESIIKWLDGAEIQARVVSKLIRKSNNEPSKENFDDTINSIDKEIGIIENIIKMIKHLKNEDKKNALLYELGITFKDLNYILKLMKKHKLDSSHINYDSVEKELFLVLAELKEILNKLPEMSSKKQVGYSIVQIHSILTLLGKKEFDNKTIVELDKLTKEAQAYINAARLGLERTPYIDEKDNLVRLMHYLRNVRMSYRRLFIKREAA